MAFHSVSGAALGGIDFLIRVREPVIAGAMLFLAFTLTQAVAAVITGLDSRI